MVACFGILAILAFISGIASLGKQSNSSYKLPMDNREAVRNIALLEDLENCDKNG